MDDQRGREHQIRVDFQLVSTNPTYIKNQKMGVTTSMFGAS